METYNSKSDLNPNKIFICQTHSLILLDFPIDFDDVVKISIDTIVDDEASVTCIFKGII